MVVVRGQHHHAGAIPRQKDLALNPCPLRERPDDDVPERRCADLHVHPAGLLHRTGDQAGSGVADRVPLVAPDADTQDAGLGGHLEQGVGVRTGTGGEHDIGAGVHGLACRGRTFVGAGSDADHLDGGIHVSDAVGEAGRVVPGHRVIGVQHHGYGPGGGHRRGQGTGQEPGPVLAEGDTGEVGEGHVVGLVGADEVDVRVSSGRGLGGGGHAGSDGDDGVTAGVHEEGDLLGTVRTLPCLDITRPPLRVLGALRRPEVRVHTAAPLELGPGFFVERLVLAAGRRGDQADVVGLLGRPRLSRGRSRCRGGRRLGGLWSRGGGRCGCSGRRRFGRPRRSGGGRCRGFGATPTS